MLPACVHVLRTLVRLHGSWLGLEPRLDIKVALGAHLLDDDAALEALEADPPPPRVELAALLDRAGACLDPEEYLDVAYGELKPLLAAGARARGDLGLALRQERHCLEVGIDPLQPPRVDLLTGAGTRPWAPDVPPPRGPSARDGFVIVDPAEAPQPAESLAPDADSAAVAHALLDAELARVEELARGVAEGGSSAGLAAALERVERLDALLTEALGSAWGAHPVAARANLAVSPTAPVWRDLGVDPEH